MERVRRLSARRGWSTIGGGSGRVDVFFSVPGRPIPNCPDRRLRAPHCSRFARGRTAKRAASCLRCVSAARHLRRAIFRGGWFDPSRGPDRPPASACCAAAPGTTNRGTSAPPTATGTPPQTGTTTTVFGSPAARRPEPAASRGHRMRDRASRGGHDERSPGASPAPLRWGRGAGVRAGAGRPPTAAVAGPRRIANRWHSPTLESSDAGTTSDLGRLKNDRRCCVIERTKWAGWPW